MSSLDLTQTAKNWGIQSASNPLNSWGITSPDFGFMTLSSTGTSQRLTPFFNYSTTALQACKNIVNYLYSSIYNLSSNQLQIAVFNAVPSGQLLSCFHVVILSSNPLPLQFLRKPTDTIGNGQDILLSCGYLYDNSALATLSTDLPEFGNIPYSWHGDSSMPGYATNFAGILSFMSTLKNSINLGQNATFSSADYAFFDSAAADFGEPDTQITNPVGIINDIYGIGTAKLDFTTLCLKYPTAAQTYYRNLCAMWLHSRNGNLPYYNSH